MNMILEKRYKQLILPDGYFNSCHASTLIALENGELLIAFFAGEKEGSEDTAIWTIRGMPGAWQAPIRCMAQPGVAHWNPVLYCEGETIWLFYKIGFSVHRWITLYSISRDGGYSWSAPRELVPGETLPRGPVKNKLIQLSNSSWLAPGSIENDRDWRAFVDLSPDHGKTWLKYDVPLQHQHKHKTASSVTWQGLNDHLWENARQRILRWDGVIQPTLWESERGRIHMLLRSTRSRIYRSDATDYGRSWCEAYPTTLPNNNSGIDLLHLGQGKLLLAYNPIAENWGRRSPLSLTYSQDNGINWSVLHDLETGEGEFSYPAIIGKVNTIHITYTWNRKNIAYQQFAFVIV